LTTTDVVVVGGGPAGASLSFGLANKGVSVCVIDGCASLAPAGETLPPQARRVISQLGMPLESLLTTAIDSFGIEARWAGRDQFRSHLFDADGNAWHINRSAFSSQLLHFALTRGAKVLRKKFLLGIARSRDVWTLTLRSHGLLEEIRCRYLVDATGRAASVARRQGAMRLRLDRLCGVAGVLNRGDAEQTLSVESVPYGWWYAAPFSSDHAIVALMSDVDVLRNIDAFQPTRWLNLFRRTNLSERMDVPEINVLRLQTLPCETAQLNDIGGDGWIAVGDAASVLDPLASAGVLKAMVDGYLAANAIHGFLASGSTNLLNEHTRRATNEFQRYLSGRRAQYGLERRWPNAQFWSRRLNVVHSGSS